MLCVDLLNGNFYKRSNFLKYISLFNKIGDDLLTLSNCSWFTVTHLCIEQLVMIFKAKIICWIKKEWNPLCLVLVKDGEPHLRWKDK